MVAGVKWFPHNMLIMLVQASVEALLSSALKMISKNLQSSKLFFQARRWSSKLMRRHFLSSSRVVSFKVSVWQWRSYSIRSRTWWRSKNINYLLGTAFRLLLWIKKPKEKLCKAEELLLKPTSKINFGSLEVKTNEGSRVLHSSILHWVLSHWEFVGDGESKVGSEGSALAQLGLGS